MVGLRVRQRLEQPVEPVAETDGLFGPNPRLLPLLGLSLRIVSAPAFRFGQVSERNSIGASAPGHLGAQQQSGSLGCRRPLLEAQPHVTRLEQPSEPIGRIPGLDPFEERRQGPTRPGDHHWKTAT